jgi:hypothetical protein
MLQELPIACLPRGHFIRFRTRITSAIDFPSQVSTLIKLYFVRMMSALEELQATMEARLGHQVMGTCKVVYDL